MDQAPAFTIRKLHVESFGCVKNATLELSPLTVLVGPNDSGKSMLLRALSTLSEASRDPSGWRGVFPGAASLVAQTFDGRGDAVRFGMEGAIGGNDFDYDVTVGTWPTYTAIRAERARVGEVAVERTVAVEREQGTLTLRVEGNEAGAVTAPDGVWPLLHERSAWPVVAQLDRAIAARADPFAPLAQAVRALGVYSIRPENLRLPASPGMSLLPDGAGLSAAIADLLLNDRDVVERLEGALSTAMPHVKRLGVEQRAGTGGVQYDIQIIARSGARISSPMISDGVLLYLGYLYLVLGPRPASVLLVEEPETGIHFGLLRSVMKLFRDMTTGAHGGPPTQVILTTHSPLLLNLVEPDEIRVVKRDDEGATQVSNFADAPDLEELLDYQGPGEVWVNQGEDYLVRGRAPHQ